METDGPEMETDGPEMETDGPEMETAENTQPETDGPEMETSENAKLETETAGPETEPDDSGAPEMETSFSNPWNVSDASVFLKYCCPECDYQFVQLEIFVIHATKYHDLSRILFEETRINIDSKHVKEEPFSELLENSEVIEEASEEPFSELLENSEVIEEASEHFDDFIEDDSHIDAHDFDQGNLFRGMYCGTSSLEGPGQQFQ